VTESYSREFAKDTVIKLQFYGKVDEETCYVNPSYPTELIVSLGTRWKTNAVAVDEKRIYLTFDDGPYHNTDRVLEILDAYDARATFFTLGMYAAVYPERIQAIHNGGHLLACHSYSHDSVQLFFSWNENRNENRNNSNNKTCLCCFLQKSRSLLLYFVTKPRNTRRNNGYHRSKK
jgi:hypothetical protein